MNGKMTNRMSIGKTLLITAFLSVSAPTLAAEYFLRTGTLNMTMPDQVSVAMWGFAQCTDASFTTCDPVSVPGPAMVVPPGDASGLTVHLRNTLTEPVSLIINGQITAMTPVWNDGTTGPRTNASQRVRSFTKEASPLGGTTDYSWTNLKPGTYLYQSGTHPQVQVQMGLYGAISSDVGANQVYPGVLYDQSVTMLFSEIDPALHAAVAGGTYGTVNGPTSTLNYEPKYFLINGKAFTPGTPALAEQFAGQRVLLRLLNAGLKSRVPTISNGYLSVIAEDGNPYPWGSNPRQQYSVFLPAAKTVDAVFVGQTPAGVDTKYVVYDRRLGLNNDVLPDGGMMANLGVKFTTNRAPVTVADNYTLVMGGTGGPTALSVAAAGVLANDTDADAEPLAVAYYSAASTGTLVGNANGSFIFTPATATYRGTATFSYLVKDALVTSAPASVSVNVISNRAPVATADSYNVPQRVSGTAYTSLDVLANDIDPDTALDSTNTINSNTISVRSGPSHGSISTSLVPGVVSYRPATAYVGPDSFTYRVRDNRGANSNTVTVTLTVGP
jgi:hypothetical protein